MMSMDVKDAALSRLIDQVQAARSQGVQLDIQGGNTKRFYGGQPKGEPLDMRPLSGVSAYEPSELVVTVRAGQPLDELEAILAEHGQCLPFEPPRFAHAGTVGGMVAAGLSGPARASAGGVRDYLLGVTMLNGNAEVLTFGGQVMKNVAGYDVARSMAGSMGVLGVILEVSLKVLPVPRAVSTLVFEVDESEALDRMTRWNRLPLPVNASAWVDGRLMVRLAGARAAVEAAQNSLGGIVWEAEEAGGFWSDLRDHRLPFFDRSDREGEQDALWRLSLPRAVPALALGQPLLIEWGGAQRWLRSDTNPQDIRSVAAQWGGHATLFRGKTASMDVFSRPSEAAMRIQQRLKRAFDPLGLFNPGRLYPDL